MARNKNEATVVLCKCHQAKKIFGIRTEKKENVWYQTWAFPISDQSAANEGYDTVEVSGNVQFGDEYPGCPYCKESAWVLCNVCGKLSCWDRTSEIFTCQWCGDKGRVSVAEHFDLSGGGY